MMPIRIKLKFAIIIIFAFINPLSSYAQTSENNLNVISVSEFWDSAHHWYDITDNERVIDPLPDQKRYEISEITKIADNILLFQKENGGWPKNYDMLAILTEDQKRKVIDSKKAKNTTFDNGATHSHVEYLAQAYSITKDKRYKKACIKGIDFILTAQYKNGGWPQYYPERKGYQRFITFNDGAMIGIMKVLRNICEGKNYYSFVDSIRKNKVIKAYEKGIRCILNCQIKEQGKLTVWCQQHDEVNFKPQNARTYELASKCTQESAEIVLFLMEHKSPNNEIVNSIKSAVEWFENSKLLGIKYITVNAPEEKFIYHKVNYDRIIVNDSMAMPIWARFYELEKNKPLFANRDGVAVYSLDLVEKERRTGYMWYNYAPQKVLDEYSIWREKCLLQIIE